MCNWTNRSPLLLSDVIRVDDPKRKPPFDTHCSQFGSVHRPFQAKLQQKCNLRGQLRTWLEDLACICRTLKKKRQIIIVPKWWNSPQRALQLGEDCGGKKKVVLTVTLDPLLCIFPSPNGMGHFIKYFAKRVLFHVIHWMNVFLGSTQMNQPHTESVNCYHVNIALFWNGWRLRVVFGEWGLPLLGVFCFLLPVNISGGVWGIIAFFFPE